MKNVKQELEHNTATLFDSIGNLQDVLSTIDNSIIYLDNIISYLNKERKTINECLQEIWGNHSDLENTITHVD